MKMTAAIMFEQGLKRPFAQSQPLKIETVDLEGPGAGEVLVRIAAAGLCHSDLSAIKGLRPRALPAVVGHEAAGVVVETGAGVYDFSVGDHVVMVFVASCGTCKYCQAGRPGLCQSSWKARSEGTLQSGARRISLNSSSDLASRSGQKSPLLVRRRIFEAASSSAKPSGKFAGTIAERTPRLRKKCDNTFS